MSNSKHLRMRGIIRADRAFTEFSNAIRDDLVRHGVPVGLAAHLVAVERQALRQSHARGEPSELHDLPLFIAAQELLDEGDPLALLHAAEPGKVQ